MVRILKVTTDERMQNFISNYLLSLAANGPNAPVLTVLGKNGWLVILTPVDEERELCLKSTNQPQ